MAYLDGFVSSLFRHDADGQRVFVLFGRTVYLVSDRDAVRIERRVKAYYAIMLSSVVVVQVHCGWRWNLIAVPVWIAAYYALVALSVRSLPRANGRATDLPRVSPRDLARQRARATGQPTLWMLLIIGLMMTAASIVAAMHRPFLWLGAVFFGLCTLVSIWQLRKL